MKTKIRFALLLVALPSTLLSQSFRVVGHSNLGGEGLNGDVTVIGSTAIVAAGMMPAAGVHAHLYNPYPCPAVSVKLVDLSNPRKPVVVGKIPVPAGIAAHGVASAHVSTPAFTGDLLAVALTVCGKGGSDFERGVAYYDISSPSAPLLLGRYQADADIPQPDSIKPCGAAPDKSGDRCASSQHSVSLIQRPDGKVLSLSLEPGASASKFPSGDLRVVDVTDPRKPVQVGAFPPAGTPIFSNNGCRPFSAGHGAGFAQGGNRGLLAFYDGGVFIVDLAGTGAPTKLGNFTYPPDRRLEGSAAYVAAARVNDRDLALISEADFIGPLTTVEVQGSAAVSGSKFGCEAIFTLYDKTRNAPVYRHPGSVIKGDLAYVGRGCPNGASAAAEAHSDMAMEHGDGTTVGADPYLANVDGKIALVDRAAQPIQTGLPNAVCQVAERVRRAQTAGAKAVILLQTSVAAPQAFSADGDPSGITIPVIMIDKPDADALRSALCPVVRDGKCAEGSRVTATLRDSPGDWGVLRVLDITDPAAPRELGIYRTPNSKKFPPRDLSVFSPQRSAVYKDMAIVPWNSDGARVIDLSAGAPREVAFFVPPDTPDPAGVLPEKAYVMSVALLGGSSRKGVAHPPKYVVVSDLNSGIYVLTAPWASGDSKAPPKSHGPLASHSTSVSKGSTTQVTRR